MYMGERMQYYKRRNDAMLYPSKIWSLISDGMAQHHCHLPHLGMKDFPVKLPQHLQGVMAHGELINIFRTFHNVKNGSNLAIHTLLLSLEKLMEKHKCFIEKNYYQIDGGSENIA
jgi:hypothetical protein